MKLVVGFLLGWSLLAATSARAEGEFYSDASIGRSPAAGDEDPFPLMCADFSGNWKSDQGERYTITQRQCAYLRVQMYDGYDQAIQTIIPDNKIRADHGTQVRHRWNAPTNATVLESHRTFLSNSRIKVTEITMFERASGDLLLQTTYRTIENLDTPNQAPRHEYDQMVFRRMGGGGSGPSQGDSDYSVPKPKKKPGRIAR